MGKLSDILSGIGGGFAFDATLAAGENEPLPRGEYIATVIKGELAEHPKTGTASYKLTFKVDEGEYAGRMFWLDLWLTENALAYTKRDLLKLGITSAEQLESPLTQRYRCKVKLALRKSDDETLFNRVTRFDVLEVVKDEPNPFPPATGGDA